MNFILFDDKSRENLLPLTFTRPIADIRIGILTIREKWERMLNSGTSTKTEAYLSIKFPTEYTIDTDNFWINGSVCPNSKLIEELKILEPDQALFSGEVLLAVNSGNKKDSPLLLDASIHRDDPANSAIKKFESHAHAMKLTNTWDIFTLNGKAIEADFDLLTHSRNSGVLSETNQVIGVDRIFVEEGARVECAILNASAGPIYIGQDAEIMEGCMVRGPFALGKHSVLKMGAKIYGGTTIGPHSKVGGEVSNSVIQGFSNKGHDGFLGNSVIGEWCNLGADSNNSNLKNNYKEVKLWNYTEERFMNTGLTFCGLIMGDHSKCGINTMFNTGTVVGVSANIFGSGFPRNFVPDFSWGGAHGFSTYKLADAFEVAETVMERRSSVLSEQDKVILQHVFELTERFRK